MCRECNQFRYEKGVSKVYYKDPICMVIKGDNGEIVSIYRNHFTPNPKDAKWVFVKGEVIAKKMFNRSFVCKIELYGHNKVIFKSKPEIRIKAKHKIFDKINERRDLQ